MQGVNLSAISPQITLLLLLDTFFLCCLPFSVFYVVAV